MVYRKTDKVNAKLAENRKKLLKAARRLIQEGGFSNVQVNLLAEMCSISPGTIYRYFPSKGDLLAEIARDGYGREFAVVQEISTLEEPVVHRLVTIIRVFLIRALRNPKVAHAMLAEQVENQVGNERMMYREKLAAQLASLIQTGINQGEFPPQDPAISAAVISGGFMEALLKPLSQHQEISPQTDSNKLDPFIENTVMSCLRVTGVSLPEQALPQSQLQPFLTA